MNHRDSTGAAAWVRDGMAGLVVFLVALPLCLGVAGASDAPYFSGILAGIIGGIVIGLLSGSQTSVSGPAAGLTAVVSSQIANLGAFETFLLAVFIGGILQAILGIAKVGFLSAFFPSSVIKGLLAAIGVILILKQIPHVVGHDSDPEGEMSFRQPDHETTFSEIGQILNDIQPAAALIGLASIALLVLWDRVTFLKTSRVPSPLVIVLLGVVTNEFLARLGGQWMLEGSHLVQVPVAGSLTGVVDFLRLPDFSQWNNPAVHKAAVTIAIVASLETLLNLEAADKLDPLHRQSPSSRELLAQGIGNSIAGLTGGIPVTSVIVRTSVNINAGALSKRSTIIHGMLLLTSVTLFPVWINRIPLASLAAILLMTGFKLASPKVIKEMWSEGKYQFLPFITTVVAIVLTDLLVGILIGLCISLAFVLRSNLRRPLKRVLEKHISGDVMRIELANQVSFFNKPALERALLEVPRGGNVLLDARNTVYIDPDVLHLINDFKDHVAPSHGVQVSLLGFNSRKHKLEDRILYVDYCSRDLQDQMTPEKVLQVFRDGNERFRAGISLTRIIGRQMNATAPAQHPIAVVLSCIDSRTPAELVFDLGLGDIFSIRIAGNVVSRKVLGSMEYGCSAGGAKLLLVMGHTRCGAITESVNRLVSRPGAGDTSCPHLQYIVNDVQQAIDARTEELIRQASPSERERYINEVARKNVMLVMLSIRQESSLLRDLENQGRIAICGAMYDVSTGHVEFFSTVDAEADTIRSGISFPLAGP